MPDSQKVDKEKRSPLVTIFLTVFIDMLGLSVIFPVLPSIFFAADSSFLGSDVGEEMKGVYYGLMIAAFPAMQFFGAPILGALSDRYGRKPILIISMTGALFGYLLFAVALSIKSLGLLFLARMIPGFMGGNISIVQSAIADVSEGKDRTKNFGLVGAAFGLGFIFGPAIGGLLADSSKVAWFSHSTPFFFTAMLTAINLISILFFFPETLKVKTNTPITFTRGINNFVKSFKIKNLRNIFMVVLLLSIGFSFFTQFFSVLLIEKFEYQESDIGFLYGWIGIWLVFTQAVVVRKLSDKIAPEKILSFSLIALSLVIFLLLIPEQSWWFYVINPMIALSQGITSPNLTTIVSKQAKPEQQGEILGINQSMNSMGQIIPPLIAGVLTAISVSLPILVGATCILLSWIVFKFNQPSPKSIPESEQA